MMTEHPPEEPAARPARRGSKLTPEVSRRICDAIRAGNYLETAAAYAGVHKSTVYRWLNDADADDAPEDVRAFGEAVSLARAQIETHMVATVIKAASGGALLRKLTRALRDGSTETEETYAPPDGRVGLEFLARAFPERWTRRAALEVSGPGGGPLEIASEERMTALADRVYAALADAEVLDAEEVDDPDPTVATPVTLK